MRRLILTAGLLAAYLSASAQGKGTIDISVANLREEPDYTAEMGTQALMGTAVEILGNDGYWLQVVTPDGYKAWVNSMAVSRSSDKDLEVTEKLICTARNSMIYSMPDKKSRPVSDLVRGDILIKGHGKDHGTVKHGMVPVSTPGGRLGWAPKKDLEDYGTWTGTRSFTAGSFVSEALKYVGVPYLWGGNSPKGFDCSGLTSYAALMNGKVLPRNASQQARLGNPVSLTDLKAGDLLFFGNHDTEKVTHVGIYIGDGRMVHASQLVRVNSIREGDSDFYENFSKFLFARRFFE